MHERTSEGMTDMYNTETRGSCEVFNNIILAESASFLKLKHSREVI